MELCIRRHREHAVQLGLAGVTIIKRWLPKTVPTIEFHFNTEPEHTQSTICLRGQCKSVMLTRH